MQRTICLLGLTVAIALRLGASTPAASYAHLPLSFEPNHGQTAPEVRFLSRGAGYTLFLTDSEAVMELSKSRVRLGFRGASCMPEIEGRQELPGKIHYFRKTSVTNIPTYARVAYQEIYPGIDLVFYGNQRQLEYDFVVAAGADPRAIRLAFDGVDALRLDREGNLVLVAGAGEIVQKAPIAYQESDGKRKRVRARYRFDGERDVRIALGKYDRSRPLIIDPVVIYSTYLGGSGHDEVRGIATDSSGKAYVTGASASPVFPTPGVQHLSWEAFVTRIDLNGQNFDYTTYIHGAVGGGIAVDASNRPYVTGLAYYDFAPTQGAVQTTFGGGPTDAFVVRLDQLGFLDWATFLGGSDYEYGHSIAVDSGDHPSVTGFTMSINFPTKVAFQDQNAGGWDDAFVSRFNPTGSDLLFSSYLGGTGFDTGMGVAVDLAQNVYVAGESNSPFLPNARIACPTNSVDAFVVKVNPLGELVYARCIGGTGADYGSSIAVDKKGSAYVAGKTLSIDFPLVNSIQAGNAGSYDAFVFKLSATGAGPIYSTYLGGSKEDYASGVVVDSDDYAYVAGATYSKDFPVKYPLQDFGGEPFSDAFLFKITPAGSLVQSTFLGGSEEDHYLDGSRIAVNMQNMVHVAGNTKSKDFPLAPMMVANPAQPAHSSPGTFDGWVARVQ